MTTDRKPTIALRLVLSAGLLAAILACGAGEGSVPTGPSEPLARERFYGEWTGRMDGEPFRLTLTAAELTVGGSWGSMPPAGYRVLVEQDRHIEIEVQTPEGPATSHLDLSEDGQGLTYREDLDLPEDAARLRRVATPAPVATFEASGFHCDLRETNGTCEEPSRINLALGEEMARTACTNRAGSWGSGECPLEERLGTCDGTSGIRRHHYAGRSRTAQSAERTCTSGLGQWRAAP